MIRLSHDAILMAFVAFPLVVIALLALYYAIRLRYRRGRETDSIYECSNCGHVYAFARNRPMDRCPRCHHLNEAVRT